MARFGDRFDAQGVLAGSKDANRCIGYLTKYLTKQIGDCHRPRPTPQRAHAARLAEALRFQPCSPRCANWLRYGIQPKNARPGLVPGWCKGKAHDADHLGYAGRRVLTSRKWSGKTLADHRADRKEWLLENARCFGNRPGPVRLGDRRARPTRTTWTTRGGCCTPSPTEPDGKPHSAESQTAGPRCTMDGDLRQPGGQHDGGRRVIELLTIEEVADRLRVSVLTVRWLRQEGRFAPAIKVGRRLMWDARDVDAWLKSQRETPEVA